MAKTDWADAVAESFETNNPRADSIHVGPDLTVTALTAPSAAIAGGGITVGDTTKNAGMDSAGITTTRFYLSTNPTLSPDDVLLGGRTVGVLAAGASQAGGATLVIPPQTAAGTYFVIAAADGDDVVLESLETNNTRSRSITISAPPGS